MDFIPYPKTPRLNRSVTITEKLDGTNAQVVWTYGLGANHPNATATLIDPVDGMVWSMFVGSRSRWVTPGKATDNYGFAGWCERNKDDLFSLGQGTHFGEWYGNGIQRGYGLAEKRFALFNTDRWGAHNPSTPACCEVVPVLYRGDLSGIDGAVQTLRDEGSLAVAGFMQPEGVIVYHSAARQVFKVLLENDEAPKGKAE